MHPTRAVSQNSGIVSGPNQAPPAIFWTFAKLATVGVILYIIAAIFVTPPGQPLFHFSEDGAITALSSVCMAMAAALALITFYLRIENWRGGGLFWLVLAGGCAFLALDEQLMFHERGGHFIEATSIGEAQFFRNWNDLIVIVYGVVAIAVTALFAREFMKCQAFMVLFAIGFTFYAVHTGLDSLIPSSVAWKDIPEESAKLFSVFFLFLAMGAKTLALTENLIQVRAASLVARRA